MSDQEPTRYSLTPGVRSAIERADSLAIWRMLAHESCGPQLVDAVELIAANEVSAGLDCLVGCLRSYVSERPQVIQRMAVIAEDLTTLARDPHFDVPWVAPMMVLTIQGLMSEEIERRHHAES